MLLRRARGQPSVEVAANPLFWPDECERVLSAERFARARLDPGSTDLLTWNLFQAFQTHADPVWLAHRLTPLGGAGLRPPLRIALWTGATREPFLHSSGGDKQGEGERSEPAGGDRQGEGERSEPAGGDRQGEGERSEPAGGDRQGEGERLEATVRIESPDVLALGLAASPSDLRGDGLVRLVGAGAGHARRLGKWLTVAAIVFAGTPVGSAWAQRAARLAYPDALTAVLPAGVEPSAVTVLQTSWQDLVAVFESEMAYLRLGGQPVRSFLEHCRARDLR